MFVKILIELLDLYVQYITKFQYFGMKFKIFNINYFKSLCKYFILKDPHFIDMFNFQSNRWNANNFGLQFVF